MEKYLRLKAIAALAALLALAGCKPSQPVTTTASAGATHFDVILAQCLAPQGNGGNWASTLAWVSEEINLRVKEAELLTGQGKNVGIHLGCMEGGSSGSVTTGVLSSVLENKKLFPGKSAQSVLSIEEAKLASRTMRFIALSTDLNFRELVRFFGQVMWIQGGSFLKQHDLLGGAIRELFGGNTPPWWNGASVNADLMLVDFSTTIRLAATLTPEILDGRISALLKGDSLDAYQRDGAKYSADLPQYVSLEQVPRGSLGKVYADALSEQTNGIGKLSDQFLASQFGLTEYRTRHARNIGPNGADYPLKRSIDAPLADGFCTITMGAMLRSAGELKVAPTYASLKPIVFCNEQTVQKILASDLYRQHLNSGHPYASRFVLAVSPSIRGALTPSIREPNLMAPLGSALGSGQLEVTKFFNPQWDKEKNGSYTFSLMDAKRANLGSGEFVPHLAVGGGYPDRRVSAWIASYFLVNNIKKNLTSKASEVRVTFALFGRDNGRATPAFHKNAVRTVFSKSPEEGEKNLRDWMGFADSWCDTMGSMMTSTFGAKLDNITLDWEVSKLPAAQEPGGAGALLVTKAINATRTQGGRHLPKIGVVFDPNVDSSNVPRLASPNPCKEQ